MNRSFPNAFSKTNMYVSKHAVCSQGLGNQNRLFPPLEMILRRSPEKFSSALSCTFSVLFCMRFEEKRNFDRFCIVIQVKWDSTSSFLFLRKLAVWILKDVFSFCTVTWIVLQKILSIFVASKFHFNDFFLFFSKGKKYNLRKIIRKFFITMLI